MNVRRILTQLAALLALAMPGIAAAQLQPTPPAVPLWRMADNGDAIQTNLGFILPPRVAGFERIGFSSARPDGGSVMAWYSSPDGAVKLRILLQPRIDIFGASMPGEDGVARNWPLLRRSSDAMVDRSRPEVVAEQLVERPIAWGPGTASNGMMRITRHAFPEGAMVQGAWYRNIGRWVVLVLAGGPEARRPDIEAAGQAAMELPWPRAPLAAELPGMMAQLRALPACDRLDRVGSGRIIQPGETMPAMLGIGVGATLLDTVRSFPHPILQPSDYCRIETFDIRGSEVLALGWRGDTSAYPAARYAFVAANGAGLFQYESFFSGEELPPEERREMTRLVWLSGSNARYIRVMSVLSDWPSYEEAKRILIEAGTRPVVMVSHPASGIVVGNGEPRD